MLHAGSFSQNVFGYFASFHTKFGPLGDPESDAHPIHHVTSVWTVALTFTHFCNITSYFIVHSRNTYTLEKSKRKEMKAAAKEVSGSREISLILGETLQLKKNSRERNSLSKLVLQSAITWTLLVFAEMHVTAEFWKSWAGHFRAGGITLIVDVKKWKI